MCSLAKDKKSYSIKGFSSKSTQALVQLIINTKWIIQACFVTVRHIVCKQLFNRNHKIAVAVLSLIQQHSRHWPWCTQSCSSYIFSLLSFLAAPAWWLLRFLNLLLQRSTTVADGFGLGRLRIWCRLSHKCYYHWEYPQKPFFLQFFFCLIVGDCN